jgi:FdhD protein
VKLDMLSEYTVFRFDLSKGVFKTKRDAVAVEEEKSLYINGEFYAVIHHSPSQVKELIIGYLLTEDIIGRVDDIQVMKFSDRGIHVELAKKETIRATLKPKMAYIVYNSLPSHIWRRTRDVKFKAEVILGAAKALNAKASTFRSSGGTHAAALINKSGEVISFAEDVSRHNAVDKVIGEAAIRNIDLSDLLLASTGRLTSEIVFKAAKVGIQLLASLSAPTSMGIKVAENLGLTLVGFVRGKSFNVYTHQYRIEEYNSIFPYRTKP